MPAHSHNAALSLLEDLIGKAKAAGADAADAVLFDGASLSLSQRLGQPERLERAEAGDLGLRVFIGKRQAIVSTTDRSKETLEAVVERAVAMARNVPEDPFNGLADPDQLAKNWPTDLEIDDPTEPSAEQMIEQARIAEEAALAVPGVTNSEGAEASWSRSHVAIAASNGFAGAYSDLAPQPVGVGAGGDRHGDGARLRLQLQGLRRRIWRRPTRSAGVPVKRRCAG